MNRKNITDFFIGQHIDQTNQMYKSFIRIHSDELKYMAPWALYEKDSNYEKNKSAVSLDDEVIDTIFCQDKNKKT